MPFLLQQLWLCPRPWAAPLPIPPRGKPAPSKPTVALVNLRGQKSIPWEGSVVVPAKIENLGCPYSRQVRCWRQSGNHLLALSFSAFDPGADITLRHPGHAHALIYALAPDEIIGNLTPPSLTRRPSLQARAARARDRDRRCAASIDFGLRRSACGRPDLRRRAGSGRYRI